MEAVASAWLSPAVHRLIDLAIEEDLGRGDVTSLAVIAPLATARGALVAREPIIVAGLAVAVEVFRRLDPSTTLDPCVRDGDRVQAGGALLRVSGRAHPILAAERTALNFLQRLCGIATLTRAYVEAAGGRARVADTRKTTPGARALDKLAVRAGGGANHRFDLSGGVLVKDNHLAVAGSIAESVRRARAHAPHGLKIEIEVDTLAQLDLALAAGADAVLLDNFTDDGVAEAVCRIRKVAPGTVIEVSGGVTLGRIPRLAAAGVDVISVGALTHGARAVDLALDLDLSTEPGPHGSGH
jgi:nicotinate-nucleotide pyrophosphorylase (carboxylating)